MSFLYTLRVVTNFSLNQLGQRCPQAYRGLEFTKGRRILGWLIGRLMDEWSSLYASSPSVVISTWPRLSSGSFRALLRLTDRDLANSIFISALFNSLEMF